MKKLIIGVSIVVVVLVVAVIAVPFVVPVSVYKDRVIALIRSETGRELTVEGPISFSIFPQVALSLEKVAFSDVPGTEQPMASLSKLNVVLRLMPLISGNIEIYALKAVDPVVHLSIAEDGTPNWEFGEKAEAAPQTESAQTSPADKPSAPGFDLRKISLGGVEIINGKLVFDDRPGHKVWTAEQVNLALSLPGPGSPLNFSGNLIWNGEKVTFSVNAEKPFDLMGGKLSTLDVSLAAAPVSLAYKGTLAVGKLPAGKGTASLDIPSLPGLASWMVVSLPPEVDMVKTIKMGVTLDADGKKAALNELTLTVNDIVAKGNIGADLSDARPQVSAVLDLGKLDLRPYLNPPGQTDTGAIRKDDAKAAAPTAPGKDGKQKQAVAADDLEVLRQVDADVSLTVAPLIVDGLQLDRARLLVRLKEGKLDADVPDMALAQGVAKAQISLDSSAATPPLQGTVSVSQVRLGPLLEGAGQKGINGVATASLSIAAQGKTIDALMKSATVKGSVSLEKGAALAYGVKNLAMSAVVDASLNKVALGNMNAVINDINAKGTLGAVLSGAKPAITGAVDFGRLDLTPFLTSAEGGTAAAKAGSSTPAASTPARQAGWSADPIDFSPLHLVDAAVTVSAQPMIVNAIQIDRLKVVTNLSGGKLTADIPDVALYKGAGKGRVVVDASGKTPSLGGTLDLSGVQIEPAMKAMAGFDSLTGTGVLSADVSAQGDNQRALVSTLAGKGAVALTDGAIKGVDLARMARNIGAALGAQKQTGTPQTQFSKMTASFTIAKGVINNPDLAVESPVLLLQGRGTVNLPQRTLNYTLTPKKVPMFGSQKGLQSLLFPILIRGSWSNPSIAPDLTSALPDSEQLLKSLPQELNIPKGKPKDKVREILKGL